MTALLCTVSFAAYAEDCTGTLPAVDCPLDENTTAPLTIDAGVTLTINGNVTLNHNIDGDDADGDGAIQTSGGTVSVIQQSDIGSTFTIDTFLIQDGDQWTTFGDILTNNDGVDINLGAGDGGEILNLNSTLTIEGEIDGNSGDIVNVGADGLGGTFTIDSQIETVTLNVVSGTLLAGSSFGTGTGLNSMSVADGTVVNLDDNLIISGALDLDGTIRVLGNNNIQAGTYTADADAGRVEIGIIRSMGATEHGAFTVTGGGPLDLSNDTLGFYFEPNTDILDTQVLTNVVVGNGGATIAPNIDDASFIYDFTVVPAGNNLNIQITRNDFETSTDTVNNKNVAEVLFNGAPNSDDTTIKAVQRNLMNASSREEFNDLLESVQPSVDATTTAVTNFIADTSYDLTTLRIDNLNNIGNRSMLTGVSSGDGYLQDRPVVLNRTRELAERRKRYAQMQMEKRTFRDGQQDSRVLIDDVQTMDEKQATLQRIEEDEIARGGVMVWGQAFGSVGDHNARANIDGYDFNTTGITIGADSGKMHDDVVLGIAYTYADTDADSDDSNNTQTELETHSISLYGGYEFNNNVYVNGSIGVGFSDVTAKRSDVGGFGAIAVGEYNGEQFDTNLTVGRYMNYGQDVFVIPSLNMTYRRIDFEDYRESGADTLNLDVQQSAINTLNIGPEIRAGLYKDLGRGYTMVPEASVSYRYALMNDDVESRAFITGTGDDDGDAGIAFAMQGFEQQDHTLDVGTGISFFSEEWQFGARYNFEYKEDFNAHSASLKASYNF